MPRIYVHDFKFEYIELERRKSEDDFYCGVTVYYNFSKKELDDVWDDLEYFFISVATPSGIASYLEQSIKRGVCSKRILLSHLLVFDTCDEDLIMSFIKNELESIHGKTEKELVLKAIRSFDWENETIPEVYNKLFSS